MFREWSAEAMLATYGHVKFRAEVVDWPLKTYFDYMNHNHDESPMYLFDHSFVEKMDIPVGTDGQYWAPACFEEDLFDVLGCQRPDSRWLIVGPERSGSTFHKDPNATRFASHDQPQGLLVLTIIQRLERGHRWLQILDPISPIVILSSSTWSVRFGRPK